MSKDPTRTDFPTGDFLSENAVRSLFGRRRPTSPDTPAHTRNGVPGVSPATGEDATAPAGGARRMRRWSVAELIARAVVPPPSTI